MHLFTPDRYFSRASAIHPRFDIQNHGFTSVLLDIDNTIRSRATNEVPPDIVYSLAQLKQAGIQPCLLSNNFHENVFELAAELDLPITAKAMKPLPGGFRRACKQLGSTPKNTLMVGDQLTTDIVGAHLVGMTAYLVCPLAEVDLTHTKVVRVFENALMGNREPEGARAFSEGTPGAAAGTVPSTVAGTASVTTPSAAPVTAPSAVAGTASVTAPSTHVGTPATRG